MILLVFNSLRLHPEVLCLIRKELLLRQIHIDHLLLLQLLLLEVGLAFPQVGGRPLTTLVLPVGDRSSRGRNLLVLERLLGAIVVGVALPLGLPIARALAIRTRFVFSDHLLIVLE